MTLRSRRLSLLAAALVLAAGAPSLASTSSPAPAPTVSAAPTGYLPVASWMALAEVNKHRRARGLAPLSVDQRLASTARAWSERMAARQVVSHNDAMFSTASRERLSMRLLGENVGWNTSVLAQHRAFLASPGHRRNVEHTAFRVAGFAVVRDRAGRLRTTQAYGTRR